MRSPAIGTLSRYSKYAATRFTLSRRSSAYFLQDKGGIPDDIRAGLLAVKPPIDVDEDGVGTLSVDVRIPDPESADDPSGDREIAGPSASGTFPFAYAPHEISYSEQTILL